MNRRKTVWRASPGEVRGLELAEIEVLDFSGEGDLPVVMVFDRSDLDRDFRPATATEMALLCCHFAARAAEGQP